MSSTMPTSQPISPIRPGTDPTVDPDCPLRHLPEHRCANRDGRERQAAGQPALRPGSNCYEGACWLISVEAQARAFATNLADNVLTLLVHIRLNACDDTVVRQTATALGLYRAAADVAGWAR